jgi:AdoMet-dependent heme synthase
VHDAVTKIPGSLKRTLDAVRFLKAQGLRVTIANVMMRSNVGDALAVKNLAHGMGVNYTLDPTITPMMDGNTNVLALRIPLDDLHAAFRQADLVKDVDEYCAPPPRPSDADMQGEPCSAGHSLVYLSPYGDVYPCVQFPLPSGNIRRQKFLDIWRDSPELKQVRSITLQDLPTCSSCDHVASCSRCPGLAYMEGNMRGPSTADCEKSYARTGIPTANMLARGINAASALAGLVQIRPFSGLS